MYFKFKGIDSRDMGVTVLRRPNIISPEMRTWTTFIDGKDGAYSHPMGLKPNSFNFTIAVEDVENIDKVLGWLTGEGRFIRSDLPNRYLNVHINEGVRLHRTVEWLYRGEVTVQVVDPFWYSIEDEWQEYKPNLIKNGWDDFEIIPRYKSLGDYHQKMVELDRDGWYVNFQTDFKAEADKTYVVQWDYEHIEGFTPYLDIGSATAPNQYHSDIITSKVKADDGRRVEFKLTDDDVSNNRFYIGIRIRLNKNRARFRFGDISFYEKGKESPKIKLEDIGEGLYRIRAWGGSNPIHQKYRVVKYFEKGGVDFVRSVYVKPNIDMKILMEGSGTKTYNVNRGEEITIHHTGKKETYATITYVGEELDFITNNPTMVRGTSPILANEGNYPSKPIIKLVKGEGKSVTIKTKDSYLTYTFPNRETEVEIDTTTKTATYNGETRDRFVETDAVGVEFPPGPIDIQVEGGTAYFKKKDRWI